MSGDAFADFVIGRLTPGVAFLDVLQTLNGCYAIVYEGRTGLHAAVDQIRSVPLLYRTTEGRMLVSDDANSLAQADDHMDRGSLAEFAVAGYATGNHTLSEEISGLRSGEYLRWDGREKPECVTYRRYRCAYDATGSLDELCEAADGAFTDAFRRVVESVGDRQIVVPLSGGLDSRLVAWMLKRNGCQNVLCYTYGLAGNREEERARSVAEALGFRWMPVLYSGRSWRDALGSEAMHDYWRFASNHVSVPHCDDWPAVRTLIQQQAADEDAVFMPGHTGDFISGGHLKYLLDAPLGADPRAFQKAIIDKHYSLWERALEYPRLVKILLDRIDEVVRDLPETSVEDLAGRYEFWEWQERQPKLIVNSVRVYEFFGHEWRIPLWDTSVMEFFRHVPLALKMDKLLYRSYLTRYGPGPLFGAEDPALPKLLPSPGSTFARARRRLKRHLNRFALTSSAVRRVNRHRRHLKDYRHHPTGIPRAYGKIRYVVGEPGKRNYVSLLVRDVLSELYKVDMQRELMSYGTPEVGDVRP